MSRNGRTELNAFIEAQTDAAKIDLRRREDLSKAALSRVRPAWNRAEAVATRLNELQASIAGIRGFAISLGIVAIGLVVYSLRATWATWMGAIIAGYGVWLPLREYLEARELGREQAQLRERIRECLFQWEAAGASESLFYRHRDHFLQELRINEMPSGTDARKAASAVWDVEADALATRRMYLLARRACETLPPDPDD
jgi:uncharacterized protein (DUF2267 family)